MIAEAVAQVRINAGAKQFDAPIGANLLDFLDSEGIHLPSACGSRGRCGLCRVRVLGGGGEVSSHERLRLTQREFDRGFRLACQTIIDGPLDIDIAPEFLASRRYLGSVIGKRLVAPRILELVIGLDDPPRIAFHPGQYILLSCTPDPSAPPLWRAFSLASSIDEEGQIRLLLRRNGACTGWVFDVVREGDSLTFMGPRGTAYVRNTMDPVLLIAGGSGMAPARSIVRSLHDQHVARKVRLYFGAVTRADLLYWDEMCLLEQQMPDFKFIPALSGEPSESDWSGERGLITEVIDRNLPSDSSAFEAYLCGKPEMVDACVPILARKGIPKERMAFDYFRSARPLK